MVKYYEMTLGRSAESRQRYDGLLVRCKWYQLCISSRAACRFRFYAPICRKESDNSRTFSLASSPRDKGPIMIAMRMRKTDFKRP